MKDLATKERADLEAGEKEKEVCVVWVFIQLWGEVVRTNRRVLGMQSTLRVPPCKKPHEKAPDPRHGAHPGLLGFGARDSDTRGRGQDCVLVTTWCGFVVPPLSLS